MIRSYKCPSCGGVMSYSAAKLALLCDHCGSTMSMEEAAAKDPELHYLLADEGTDKDGDQVKEYACTSCGATLVTDDHTAATVCAFCGNAALIPSRMSGEFKPELVIPFKVEKKDAQKLLHEWAGKAKMAPANFQNAAINDLQGIYVPFWLYSATAVGEVTAEGRQIEETKTEKEEITTTKYFDVRRVVKNRYTRVPHDASDKMPDDSMWGIEPYDYSEIRDFRLPYLAGYQAEKRYYDESRYEAAVWEAIGHDIVDNAEETITGYDEHTVRSSNYDLSEQCAEYALLPVWSLVFNYAGKTYPVYVNGQTGKIDGALPISKGKVWLRFLIFFVIFTLIALLLGLVVKFELFEAFWSWPILGLIAGGIAALIAKGSHNRRFFPSKRTYTDKPADLLDKYDRYRRTDVETRVIAEDEKK